MAKPKIKQIVNEAEFDENDPDACLWYLTHDENMTQVMLTIKTNKPITPEEYLHTLADFLNQIELDPDGLFVEDADIGGDLH